MLACLLAKTIIQITKLLVGYLKYFFVKNLSLGKHLYLYIMYFTLIHCKDSILKG